MLCAVALWQQTIFRTVHKQTLAYMCSTADKSRAHARHTIFKLKVQHEAYIIHSDQKKSMKHIQYSGNKQSTDCRRHIIFRKHTTPGRWPLETRE